MGCSRGWDFETREAYTASSAHEYDPTFSSARRVRNSPLPLAALARNNIVAANEVSIYTTLLGSPRYWLLTH